MEEDEKQISEEEEKSELEEEIEEIEEELQTEEEIFDEDIVEFIPTQKTKAPSLEKINLQEEPVTLEENVRKTTHLPEEDEDDSFKYGNTKTKEESNYQNFDSNYSSEIITNFEKLGNERDNPKGIKFIESSEARISKEKDFEKYEQVKRFDEKDFRKNEFERKEIKYKPLN